MCKIYNRSIPTFHVHLNQRIRSIWFHPIFSGKLPDSTYYWYCTWVCLHSAHGCVVRRKDQICNISPHYHRLGELGDEMASGSERYNQQIQSNTNTINKYKESTNTGGKGSMCVRSQNFGQGNGFCQNKFYVMKTKPGLHPF